MLGPATALLLGDPPLLNGETLGPATALLPGDLFRLPDESLSKLVGDLTNVYKEASCCSKSVLIDALASTPAISLSITDGVAPDLYMEESY